MLSIEQYENYKGLYIYEGLRVGVEEYRSIKIYHLWQNLTCATIATNLTFCSIWVIAVHLINEQPVFHLVKYRFLCIPERKKEKERKRELERVEFVYTYDRESASCKGQNAGQ